MKTKAILFLIATIAAWSCTPPPAPVARPSATGEERFLVDPRIGYERPATPAIEKKLDAAWQFILAGDDTNARKRLDEIRAKEPNYLPAQLAEAAIDLRHGNLDAARPIVERLVSRYPQYTAAEVYQAEIAIAEKQTQRAYDLYRDISLRPGAPATAAERIGQLQTTLFDQLFNAAIAAPDAEAVRLLREALTINPGASAACILLVQKLVGQHEYDEARRELAPIMSTADVDRPEVQEALSEIDVSRGQYEEAIARYERLVKRDGRFKPRLDQIKEQFAEANMPPQFRRAIESDSITRADLAVLMYWKVSSVRFASNLATPPIAIDIGEAPGRDEIIRAIALGIYAVDPVTRRVNPYGAVNAGALSRIAARLLLFRGASCARQAGSDPQRVLAACGTTDATVSVGFDGPVSGRAAATVMEQVDRAISR